MRLLILILIIPLAVLAEKWETLDKCKLITNSYNDGDSFHISYKGKEYIFRLYFVDTPETNLKYKNRVKEQAKYWKISTKSAIRIGKKAKKFSDDNLKGKITVFTKWDDAKGSSKIPRYFAFVNTASGNDLAELLVSNGLARIYGMRVNHPEGKKANVISKRLKKLESDAKRKK
ncbi:thermonuclease family protein [bacterium]|nr:thermonuclease family protein [bacterium]